MFVYDAGAADVATRAIDVFLKRALMR